MVEILRPKLNRPLSPILLIAILGFLCKLYFIFAPRYITGDGAIFLCMARSLGNFDLSAGLGAYQHPMLAVLTALVSMTGLPPHISVLLLNGLLASVILFPMGRILKSLRLPDPFIYLVCACLMFYPRWFQYSTMALTETLFGTLLVFAAGAIRERPSFRSTLALSVLAAAAYLTKTEGALLFALAPAAILSFSLVNRRGFKPASLHSLLFVVLSLLFSFPFLLHLKHVTGKWTVSAKADFAVSTDSYGNADANRFALTQDNEWKSLPPNPEGRLFSAKERFGAFKINLPYFFSRMPKTTVWPLFLLWMAGMALFLFRIKKERENPAFFPLWIFSAAYLSFYCFYYITFRFFVPTLPFAFIWTAYVVRLFFDPLKLPRFKAISFAAVIGLMILSLFLAEKERARSPFTRGLTGGWVKSNLPAEKIMALHGADLDYYFDLQTVQVPFADAGGLYAFAKKNSVAYVLLGDFDVLDKDCKRPQLVNVASGGDPRFLIVKEFQRDGKDRYAVIRIN
jgi:hypothetical protein